MRRFNLHPNVLSCGAKNRVLKKNIEGGFPENWWNEGEVDILVKKGFLVEIESDGSDTVVLTDNPDTRALNKDTELSTTEEATRLLGLTLEGEKSPEEMDKALELGPPGATPENSTNTDNSKNDGNQPELTDLVLDREVTEIDSEIQPLAPVADNTSNSDHTQNDEDNMESNIKPGEVDFQTEKKIEMEPKSKNKPELKFVNTSRETLMEVLKNHGVKFETDANKPVLWKLYKDL